MTLISSTRFFNGALLAGAMALISTEVAVAQPAPGTADSSGRLVQTWDKTFPRSEKVDHQKVTFKNRYGITLAADVYLPKDRGNKKLAALVISGPFGAVKEQASGLYAQTLAERGFVTLAFDPSYTGESSGEPRNIASPDINTEDFMAAVDFMGLQPNDLTDSKTLAHLLKYDSLLGKLDAEVTAGEGGLVVDGKPITVFSERNPASIPWRQCEVDIVIEATGLFTDREKAAVHIHSGGAKRVIISAPGKNDDLTIVMGVNESLYSPDKHYVISNGSCTTNGLAPAAQVLHQHFGIKHGLMNTTHAYTNSQALHDQPEKDLRGARAAALSIVPYSSGAAKALGKVIPELDGRLTGYSLRVPVPVVSIVDLTVTLERDVTVEEVNNAFREAAAAGPLKGILGYSDEPLVSSDYQGDPRSSIIDGLSTLVIGGNMVKILAWYDNEWGFSNRLVDLALMMAKRES